MPHVAAAIDLVEPQWRADGGPERTPRQAAERREQADQFRVEAETTGRPCYLRFGALPGNGRSVNHRDHRAEDGVSVYAAWCLPGDRYVIDLRDVDALSSLFIIDASAPVYEVTGTLLPTTGADGEPLIAQPRAHRVHLSSLHTTA